MRRLGLDASQDEDVVQEAWARWLKTQPARVEQWLKVAIHTIAVDQVRRRKGDEPIPLDVVRAL